MFTLFNMVLILILSKIVNTVKLKVLFKNNDL